MYLGVDYYPEQWDPQQLQSDLETIRELGANTIRIGEFAWHMMEPERGKYDFSYFDQVIAAAKEHDLHVIFGTPTATAPAWLIKEHPEVRSKFIDGSWRSYGGRHTTCYSSAPYRDACRRIIVELAKHYASEAAIVAWQTDNELGHEGSDECWCEDCHQEFQKFLEKKFSGDIDRLNFTYGTRFWSQEYNDFTEIPIPTGTITTHNPALRLDWERFRSQLIVDFNQEQVDLLREHLETDALIIHDFPGGGLDKHVDYAAVARPLDRVAYNNYPVWGGQKEPLPPSEIAFGLDHMRGLKRQNFWVTEAIMGAQGHDVTGYLPRPKQAQMWSYQAMARGCDSLLYFRYRGATKGAEQFCYGILDADNKKRRRFYEVQEFFADIVQYQEILKTPIKASVAILYDYDSLSSLRIQRQSKLLNTHQQMKIWHNHFYQRNVMVDILDASTPNLDLTNYQIIIVAHLTVTNPVLFDHLRKCADLGAQIIITYRSSVKDQNNNLVFDEEIPLGITDFVGGVVEETESVQESDCFELQKTALAPSIWTQTGEAGIFRDMFRSTTAQPLYHYHDRFYHDYAALTVNQVGDGCVYYAATSLSETLGQQLIDFLLKKCEIETIDSVPGLEIVKRSNAKKSIYLVMNHNDEYKCWREYHFSPYECCIIRV